MAKQRLDIEISGNDSKFGAAADRTMARLNKIGGAVRTFAAAIGISFGIHSVRRVVDFASNLTHMSDALGISTDALQEWEYAISAAGGSMEDIEKNILALSKAVKTAIEGGEGGNMAKTFERLGVSFAEIKTLRIEDVFMRIANHIGESENRQQMLGDALIVMGRSAVPTLTAMANGFAANVAEAKNLGVAVREDVIRGIEEAETRLGKFLREIRGKSVSNLMGIGEGLVTAFYHAQVARIVAKAGLSPSASRALTMSIGGMLTGRLGGGDESTGATANRYTTGDMDGGDYWSNVAKTGMPSSSAGRGTAADALARIGLFRGGTSQIERQKVNLLQQIASNTSRTAAAMNEEL